jgi:CHAD domain-containing protein
LFGSVLDARWVAHIRAELKWIGAALGKVRDADVLAVLLDREEDGSSFDAEGRRQLRSSLNRQRRIDCRALGGILAGTRYLSLVEQLDEGTQRPPLHPNTYVEGAPNRSALADQPAREVLPTWIGRRWRSLRGAVRKAGRHPSDGELHGMRIRAKELRYVAELAAPVVGKPARRTATAAEAAQDVLGEHHDAVSAEVWLRSQAMKGTIASSYSAGRLAAEETRLQRTLRRRWPSVFHELERKRAQRSFSSGE